MLLALIFGYANYGEMVLTNNTSVVSAIVQKL